MAWPARVLGRGESLSFTKKSVGCPVGKASKLLTAIVAICDEAAGEPPGIYSAITESIKNVSVPQRNAPAPAGSPAE